MPDYKDFLRMARERQTKSRAPRGGVAFTRHAEFKMKQYGLSAQRVRSVIRNPRRREEGIAKDTVAVMQPPSVKRVNGDETWTQEIWVMFVIAARRKPHVERRGPKVGNQASEVGNMGGKEGVLRVISTWRYPGVSPKRNPVPEEILREIEEGGILEEEII